MFNPRIWHPVRDTLNASWLTVHVIPSHNEEEIKAHSSKQNGRETYRYWLMIHDDDDGGMREERKDNLTF
jgi:hypothetical protein